jgi:DNA polymerase III alpha subunit
MCKYPGLQFEKFDLHVHTPASHDFADKHVTATDIVNRALRQGLRGIAITDHNTGDFVDKVKAAAQGKRLAVFPGVEICCTGGKSGIHIIAILGEDKATKHVSALLAAIGIAPDDFGKNGAVTTKAPYEVIDIIASPPYRGIAVLAHCTSSKGVLHDITGTTRQKIFEHPGLLAVETSDTDFTDEQKKGTRKRAVDLLDGKDDNYGSSGGSVPGG